jgi:glyoxylase-like metal-dependent hydrolase (beta-lactamase superfamily II)
MEFIGFTGGPFAENGWLVVHSGAGTAVIVDPGGGAPELLAEVERRGVEPVAILLTHAHLDHVDGIPRVLERHPDLSIWVHPEDRPLYDGAPRQASWFGLEPPRLPSPTGELVAGRTWRHGDLALEVRFAPGHAPGHVVFLAPDDGVALVGDVIFQGSIGRTDLPGGDFHVLMESIRREILSLPDETRLLPGHGPETTVAHERETNPFLVENLRGGLA